MPNLCAKVRCCACKHVVHILLAFLTRQLGRIHYVQLRCASCGNRGAAAYSVYCRSNRHTILYVNDHTADQAIVTINYIDKGTRKNGRGSRALTRERSACGCEDAEVRKLDRPAFASPCVPGPEYALQRQKINIVSC